MKTEITKLQPTSSMKELEDFIANTAYGEGSKVFTFTPAMAKEILKKYNYGNRPVTISKVKEFTIYMSKGNWPLTGQSVEFANNGRLLNGQHRMEASVKSGQSFQAHVTIGEEKNFPYIDRGKTRSGKDALVIAGYKNAVILESACRWLMLIQNGIVSQRLSYTQDQILECADNHPNLQLFCTDAHAAQKKNSLTGGMMAALFHIWMEANPKIAAEVIQGLKDGSYNGRARPFEKAIMAIKVKRMTPGVRVHDVYQYKVLTRAWHLALENKAGIKKDFSDEVFQ